MQIEHKYRCKHCGMSHVCRWPDSAFLSRQEMRCSRCNNLSAGVLGKYGIVGQYDVCDAEVRRIQGEDDKFMIHAKFYGYSGRISDEDLRLCVQVTQLPIATPVSGKNLLSTIPVIGSLFTVLRRIGRVIENFLRPKRPQSNLYDIRRDGLNAIVYQMIYGKFEEIQTYENIIANPEEWKREDWMLSFAERFRRVF